MKNHKQISVDSNFVINNYKDYVTERKQTLFKFKSGSEQIITAQTPSISETYGRATAIEGNYAFVGKPGPATQAGAVEVYQKSNGTWVFKQLLVAADASNDDDFGLSLDVSGTTLAIGAPQTEDNSETNHGAVYIFDLQTNGTWTQTAKLTADNKGAGDKLGNSVAIDGDVLVTGAYFEDTTASNSGAAYVFSRSGGSWSQTTMLKAADAEENDEFGYPHSVAIQGNTIVVGAPKEDTGFTNAGAAYIFTYDGSSWSQAQKIQAATRAAEDFFSLDVNISGDYIVLGAILRNSNGLSNSGAAYVFKRGIDGTYTEKQILTPSDAAANDRFGFGIDIQGDLLMIGAYQDNTDAGSLYLFQKTADDVWRQNDKIVASNAASNDEFASSVKLSGTSLIVGSRFSDPGSVSAAGSAYFYEIEPSEEFTIRTPNLQPPFSLLTPGIHSLRTK